jgi:hypothetical protein
MNVITGYPLLMYARGFGEPVHRYAQWHGRVARSVSCMVGMFRVRHVSSSFAGREGKRTSGILGDGGLFVRLRNVTVVG